MSLDDAMTAGPCRHLDEARARCVNGGSFPHDCGGCPSYEDADLSREAEADGE
jgi:hypothetical protein